MHYLVNLIVAGETAEEALENAESYAGVLCGQDDSNWSEFDWFDMDGRWGKSQAFKTDSKEGAELLKQGMESSRGEFENAMKHVRYMIENYSDEQIYNEDFGSKEEIQASNSDIYYLSRWQFSGVYGNKSGSSYVWGEEWGGAIANDKELTQAIEGDNNWVVSVDMHN